MRLPVPQLHHGFHNQAHPQKRAGLTLLEVIVALTILLFSLGALWHLISLSGNNILDGRLKSEGTLRCQSKLAEVLTGAQPMGSTSWAAFPESPEWNWRLDCQQGEVANLWNVQVAVQHKRQDGSMLEISLNQMVIDPSVRGNTLQWYGVSSTNSGTGGTSSGTQGSGSSSGGSAPKTTTPTPATTPAATAPKTSSGGGSTGGGGGGSKGGKN